MSDQELEVKYYLHDLSALERRLNTVGAQLVQPRTHEVNLRFDTPQGELSHTYQVLRLRRDIANRLTYKGPSRVQGGARLRTEIEFEISDFEAARAFLEALGYQVALLYEKYRTVYELEGVEVSLDEMPYGDFAELEGPDPERIQAVNQRLELDWSARAPESYVGLFIQLRQRLGLEFRDLSFENFSNLEVEPEQLGVRSADRR
jgi:adenylate cyclase class 2